MPSPRSGRGGARPGAGRPPKSNLIREIDRLSAATDRARLEAQITDRAIAQAIAALERGEAAAALEALRTLTICRPGDSDDNSAGE